MLTVWRKIHLEVDSMAESLGNYEAGRIYSKVTVGQTPVWITIVGVPPLEEGQYQGGRLSLNTSTSLRVVDNTTNRLQVKSEGSPVSLRINQLFYLFDDDDFDSDDGTEQDGDEGEDILCLGTQPNCFDGTFSLMQPSTNVNENVFAPAYVQPEYDWAANQGFNQSNIPYFANIANLDANGSNERSRFDPYRNTRNTSNTIYERDDFWIGYILVGYQWDISVDGDPLDPSAPNVGGGVAPADNAITDLVDDADDSLDVFKGSVGAIVFIETMRDVDATLGSSTYNWKARVPPHELGHQFGLRGHQPVFGIMYAGGNSIQLVPRHVSVIRWRVSSPGEPNF